MSLTYVIPDIHGRHDLLSQGLVGINAHSAGGTIVTIGDYVDKGPDSRRVIERLLPGIAAGWKLVALKGNHDAMMVDALRNPSKMASWLEKGGDAALASYGGDPAAIPQRHLAWLDRLRVMHVDDHRLDVHAGVDPEVPLDQQSEATLLWKRYPKGFPGGVGGRHILNVSSTSPDGPLLYQGRTNLDTLACRTGRLVIGIYNDDRRGGPLDFVGARGSPAVR